MYYFCRKCQQFVTPIAGTFQHPDLGENDCKVCPVCKRPVMVKDKKEPA